MLPAPSTGCATPCTDLRPPSPPQPQPTPSNTTNHQAHVCALPLQDTTDEHFRFHAFSTLTVCLERVRGCQQDALEGQRDGSNGGGVHGAAGPEAAAPADPAAQAAVPLLDPPRLQQLLQRLWQGFEVRLHGTVPAAAAPAVCRQASLASQAGRRACRACCACRACREPAGQACPHQRLHHASHPSIDQPLTLLTPGPWLHPCQQAALSQTLQRVHAAFECLVDILQAQQQLCSEAAAAAPSGTAAAGASAAAPAAGASAGAAAAASGDGGAAEVMLLGIARSLLALGEREGQRQEPQAFWHAGSTLLLAGGCSAGASPAAHHCTRRQAQPAPSGSPTGRLA